MNGGFHRRRHEHSPHQYICFELIPYFFSEHWSIFPMYRWFENLMFSNSGNDASSFLELEEFPSLFARVWSFCPSFLWAGLTFSCRFTWEFPTSKFESQFPEARPNLFLSSSFTGLTRDPDLCGETSSLHWLCITRLVGLACATREPSLEVVSCPRFDMAPITMRSPAWEGKLLKWMPEYVESSWYWTNTEGDSTHLSRNFLWCQRVGFWCQHTWFGSWVPSRFSQTTNQEQLCRFLTRLSLLNFLLW